MKEKVRFKQYLAAVRRLRTYGAKVSRHSEAHERMRDRHQLLTREFDSLHFALSERQRVKVELLIRKMDGK